MVYIGIIGYGTVGSGVFEVINKNKESIAKRAGDTIEVKKICDLRKFSGDPAEGLITKDFNEILDDDEISIVVETMGGKDLAYTYVKNAIERGKSVCTSNKELVASYGASLIKLAKEKNVNFLFEASVGGGIPIIRPLNEALTADKILEIKGILNGTTNYILTKMNKDGRDYEEALEEAREMGYAERDPSADVMGFDTCRKIAILTSLAYGKQVDFSDIPTEGITKIGKEDMEYAKALRGSIKLIGESKIDSGVVYARVRPMIIGENNPLYSVNDVFNAIFVKGNVIDDVMFYGRGAGKLPTASAVVADVVDVVKNKGRNILTIWSEEPLPLGDIRDYEQRFFVRIPAKDKNLAKDIDDIEEVRLGKYKEEFAFVTGRISETKLEERLKGTRIISKILVNL